MILTVLCTLSPVDPGSNAASSSIAPVDGALDLQEDEMEQSVLGQESYLIVLMPKQNSFNIGLCVYKMSSIFVCMDNYNKKPKIFSPCILGSLVVYLRTLFYAGPFNCPSMPPHFQLLPNCHLPRREPSWPTSRQQGQEINDL